MLKSIKTINKVDTKENADGAVLEMREIELFYTDKLPDRGYTFVWVNADGKEFPPQNLGQVVVSKENMLFLISKAEKEGWFL